MLPTCGADGYPGLCRPCALEVGDAAWCDGHADEARESLAWATALPDHWDLVVSLWWVSTGEARLGSLVGLPDGVDRLSAPVRAALTAR